MAAKGKSKGKGKRMTLTQRLASARDYARSTRSYTAFTNDWSSSDSGPPPMQNSSSSSSSASSGYEAPPAGWVGILYVLQNFGVQLAHLSLNVMRTLRDILVPIPPAMANQGDLIAQGLDLDMPQHDAPVNPDLARISQEHPPILPPPPPRGWYLDSDGETWRRQSPLASNKGKDAAKGKDPTKGKGRTIHEAMAYSNNDPKGKGIGHLMSQRTTTWPEVQAQQTAVGAFVLQRVGTAPEPTSSEVLGHGPFWLNHVKYIQLSGDREENSRLEFGPVITITHEIGVCPQTRYFCTKTCLNMIEVDLLLQACVIIPNDGAFAAYMHPQFRTLVTPPWTRQAVQHYMGHIAPQIAEMIALNPYFGRGGPLLKLNAIHYANNSVLDNALEAAENSFYELHPQETAAWQQLFIQFPSRQFRDMPFGNDNLRTSVRLQARELAEDLQAVSNSVNARYYDNAGSLHFVFYNGGFQEDNLDAQFPTGLNQGNLSSTREVMDATARMLNYNLDSLLFRWLQNTDGFQRDPFAFGSFTPRLARLGDFADLADPSMDVDM
jgi:hypothetical protein